MRHLSTDPPRPHPRATRRGVRAARLAGCVVVLALAGCGAEPDTTSDSPAPSPTPTTSSSPTASPSTSPTATLTPSPSTSPTTLVGRLLSAEELPPLNDELAWQGSGIRTAQARPLGPCQKFDLFSIGAREVAQRDFTADGATTVQQVAQFPDRATAQRASQVLASWHRGCQVRIPNTLGVQIDPIRTAAVPTGSARWYLGFWTEVESGMGHVNATGFVTVGSRLSLFTSDVTAQDRNYDRGQDPMELALAVAAGKLS